MNIDNINEVLGKNTVQLVLEGYRIELKKLNFETETGENFIKYTVTLNFTYKDLTGESKTKYKLEQVQFKLKIDFESFEILIENIDSKQPNQLFMIDYPIFKFFTFKVICNFVSTLIAQYGIENYQYIEVFPAQVAVAKAYKGISLKFQPHNNIYLNYLKNRTNFLVVVETFFKNLRDTAYRNTFES